LGIGGEGKEVRSKKQEGRLWSP